MPHQHMSNELNTCIQACLDCYRSCQQMAAVHCPEVGGKHVEPDHLRLMLDCAEICRASAALMINQSPFHQQLCGVCAQICRACAESCRALGDMDECAQACERCAESCERMAAGSAS
ncbi:four-helix bundle copper-binding protein [Lysobacter korlensis]